MFEIICRFRKSKVKMLSKQNQLTMSNSSKDQIKNRCKKTVKHIYVTAAKHFPIVSAVNNFR